MTNDSLIGIYEKALENIKFALNNSPSLDALHTIGNEVSWALAQREAKPPISDPRYQEKIEKAIELQRCERSSVSISATSAEFYKEDTTMSETISPRDSRHPDFNQSTFKSSEIRSNVVMGPEPATSNGKPRENALGSSRPATQQPVSLEKCAIAAGEVLQEAFSNKARPVKDVAKAVLEAAGLPYE